jgi:hypothetical protein
MSAVTPDTDAALNFLAGWNSGGPWTLSAIDPQRKGGIETRTFHAYDAAQNWIDRWQNRRNLYFSVNTPKGDLTKKARKADIAAVTALHVDLDAPGGIEVAIAKADLLPRLKAYQPPPSVILDSGGGLQGFWLLAEPAPLNGPGSVAHLEAYNRQIEIQLGGDHCHNIDRIMRLPGTVNLPDEVKRAKGRKDYLAVVLEADWKRRYDLAAFTPAADPKPQPPEGRDKSRSAAAFRKGVALRRAGLSFEEMVAALLADRATAEWTRTKGQANGQRELRRIWEAEPADVALDDFYAYMPMHNYIFVPTRQAWPAASVNARIGRIPLDELDDKGKPKTIAASAWLDRHQPVEQMSWCPGLPLIINDRLLLEGGWAARPGAACFNLYHGPRVRPGNPADAGQWVDHVKRLYPQEADHIIDWLACRVQRPDIKINHALLLGGAPGIGKDSILVPIRHAVGPWNFREASPQQLLGRFNGFLKSVVLRVSEARDLGEFDRFALYDHMKTYLASPPEVLTVDEKHLHEHAILNCTGVVITSNHKTDGLYLPADDRRHFVAWSDLNKEDKQLAGDYWNQLYGYYQDGGTEAVAALLLQRDLSAFDPKAPPPLTAAFWAVADAYRPSEESELADLLDLMERPAAFTLATLLRVAENHAGDSGFVDWLKDRKNRRVIPHRLEAANYSPVRNPDAEDGLWKTRNKRQVVYARRALTLRDQIAAAKRLD